MPHEMKIALFGYDYRSVDHALSVQRACAGWAPGDPEVLVHGVEAREGEVLGDKF